MHREQCNTAKYPNQPA